MDVAPPSRPFRVAGHAGMRATLDGELVIKPAYPAERRFYDALAHSPVLAPMRPFIPAYLGTLSPHAVHAARLTGPPRRTDFIVLENLCSAFTRPNILDIKLGTVFHDDLTDPAKVLRMQHTARETTSLRTGLRLTDFQVHDSATAQPIATPKSYGKALKEADLPRALAQFFPAHDVPPGSTRGLPPPRLLPVLRGTRAAVARLRDTYARIDVRLVGASLVLIYEAHWPAPPDAPQYLVKLVDFAHARVAPGLGPDLGVLLGLDTLLALLDGRIAELT